MLRSSIVSSLPNSGKLTTDELNGLFSILGQAVCACIITCPNYFKVEVDSLKNGYVVSSVQAEIVQKFGKNIFEYRIPSELFDNSDNLKNIRIERK